MKRVISVILALLLIIPTPLMAMEDSRARAVRELRERLDEEDVGSRKSEYPISNEKVRVIVELDETPMILDGSLNSIHQAEDKVKREMKSLNIPFVEFHSLDTLISGFSIEVESKHLDKIRSLEGVKSVNSSVKYTLSDKMKPQLYTSLDLMGVREVWNNSKLKGEGTLVGILDTGFDINHEAFTLPDDVPVKYTENDMNLLIAQKGLPGKYINSKVPYVYNYQDMTPNQMLDSYGSRHGLHVAGIVGANATEGEGELPPVLGVAPHAQLAILKVFSGDPTMPYTYTDAQVRAIEDAIKLGCDSINLSLGGRAGKVQADDSMINTAFRNAREAGVFVAVAQGNEATPYEGHEPNGLYYAKKENPDLSQAGSPANSKWAVSVASFNNTNMVNDIFEISYNGIKENISYLFGSSTDEFELEVAIGEIVHVGLGQASDFSGKNLTGKVALISRGGNTFSEKALNAKAAGAKGAIIYNNTEGTIRMNADDVPSDFPLVSITKASGEKILENIDNIEITFKKGNRGIIDYEGSGKMSDFSSWGPNPDLKIKPEITAPGGEIWSTDEEDKYQSMSGTSMATPHIAGLAALISQHIGDEASVFYEIQKNPKAKEEVVRLLMMNTAVPLKEEDSYFNVRRQGAGIANLPNIVKNEVLVRATGGRDTTKDGKIDFHETNSKNIEGILEITNYSNEDKVYKGDIIMLKDQLEESPLYEDSKIINEKSQNMNFYSNFVGERVRVPANSTITLNVNMDFSNDAVDENSFVEGFIRLISESEEDSDLTVPYLTFYGNWNAPRIFDKFPHELIDGKTPQNINFSNGEVASSVKYLNKNLKVFNRGDGAYYVWNPDFGINKRDNVLSIAFSPIRNARDLKIELLDENENFLSLFYARDYVTKLFPGRYKDATSILAGNKAPYAKDGEITKLKLSAKVDDESIVDRQEVLIPILSDQQKPVIEDYNINEDNGRKILNFKLSDSTDLFRFGFQAVNSDGSLGRYIEFENFSGTFDTNDWEIGPDGKWYSDFADMIGENSYKQIEEYKNGNSLSLDFTEIAKASKLVIYAEDLAGNFSTEFLDIGDDVANIDITNSSDSSGKIEIYLIGEDGDKVYAIKPGETQKLPLYTKGSISIMAKEKDKYYNVDTFKVGDEEFKDNLKSFSPNSENPQEFVLFDYFFDKSIEVKVQLSESIPKAEDEKGYPEKRHYPIVAMDKPGHYSYVSAPGEDNIQLDPEIVDGKLQVRGNVLYSTPEEFDRLEIFFNDITTGEIASPIHRVESKKISEKHYFYMADDGSVLYDAMSLFFEDEVPLPVRASNNYVLTVRAINKDGKMGEVGINIVIDAKAPMLNVKLMPRDLSSRSIKFEYTMTDDSIYNVVSVEMNGEEVYRKTHSIDEKTIIAGQASYKGTFTYDNLPEGINEFEFIVREDGTNRTTRRKIVVYRLGR